MLSPGTVVAGRYQLLTPIGEGAMAAVWQAEDVTLKRPVAVKFLHVRGASDPQAMVDQFLREARIAASVQHRNVIHTVDFGTVDTQPFMVMELLDGESLQDRIEREPPLSPEQVVHLASLTLRGLSAVHDAGIVHRDLKPANIFLQRDADTVYPKILDFGISRSVTGGEERPSAIATQVGLIVGTPDYMSPEQARGDTDIDRRADIYSMGVILYQGLSGQLPFNCKTIGELIVAILTKEPPTLQQLRPDVHPALSKLVEQAMSKDRGRRFGEARAMRRALMAAAELAFKRSRVPEASEPPLALNSSAPPPPMPVAAAAQGPAHSAGGWGDFVELSAGSKAAPLELDAAPPARAMPPAAPASPAAAPSAGPAPRRPAQPPAAKPPAAGKPPTAGKPSRAAARPGASPASAPNPPPGASAYAANAFDGLGGGSIGPAPTLELDPGAVRAADRGKGRAARGERGPPPAARRRASAAAKAGAARDRRRLLAGVVVVVLALVVPSVWYMRSSPLPEPSGVSGAAAALFTRPPARTRRANPAKHPVHLRDVSFSDGADAPQAASPLPVEAPGE